MFKKLFNKLKNSMNVNQITIDGQTFQVNGNNVRVTSSNGLTTITVDGTTITSGKYNSDVKIKWEGDLANLDCTTCEINGNVTGDIDATTVKCGNVNGNVDGTTINCGDVKGYVDGVTVNCKSASGGIKM